MNPLVNGLNRDLRLELLVGQVARGRGLLGLLEVQRQPLRRRVHDRIAFLVSVFAALFDLFDVGVQLLVHSLERRLVPGAELRVDQLVGELLGELAVVCVVVVDDIDVCQLLIWVLEA